MNKIFLTTLLTITLTTTVATQVRAQTTAAPAPESNARPETSQRVRHPFRIELGAFFPSDKATRNLTGSTYSDIGLGYEFVQSAGERSKLVYGVYVDARGRQRDRNGTKTTSSASGVGLSARIVTGDASQAYHPFVLVGLGVHSSYAEIENFGSKTDKTKVGVGGKIEVGVEIGSSFLVGAGYSFQPDVKISKNGTDYKFRQNGAHVRLGFRF